MKATLIYYDDYEDRRKIYGCLSQLNISILRSGADIFRLCYEYVTIEVPNLDKLNEVVHIVNLNTYHGVTVKSWHYTIKDFINLFKNKQKEKW